MSRRKKLLEKLMSGRADNSFPFDDLVLLLNHEGWEMRGGGGGSHKIFRNVKNQTLPMLNIQKKKDGTAKSYQVEQAREAITEKRKNEGQKNEE